MPNVEQILEGLYREKKLTPKNAYKVFEAAQKKKKRAPWAPTEADRELSQLRNPGEFRGWAACRFSGAYNSATGFGLFSSNQIDIFAQAAGDGTFTQGESPYNNWLTKESKPLYHVFPRSIGLYIGDMGDAGKICTVLAEHGYLEVKAGSATSILKQPALTIPAGTGVERRIDNSAAGAVGYAERLGPLHPVGIYKLPKGSRFEKDQQIKALFKLPNAALTYLQGLAGSFPAATGIIAVEVYGVAEYVIGTNR